MNELTLDGKIYISSKRAAEITGYAKDYVGQLCREGRVEARLVGRNWYILETAIREHRFGAGEKVGESDSPRRSYASESWDTPSYAPESPTPLPTLTDHASVPSPEEASQGQNSAHDNAIVKEPSSLLSDMQSAWQEWYMTRQSTTDEPSSESFAEEAFMQEEDEGSPVTLTSIEGAIEETLPATEAEPERTLDLTRPQDKALNQVGNSEESGRSEEGTILEERLVVRKGRAGRKLRGLTISPVLIRSLCIAVICLVVAVTIVGTGYASKFSDFGLSRSSEINYLAGVSFYNKN